MTHPQTPPPPPPSQRHGAPRWLVPVLVLAFVVIAALMATLILVIASRDSSDSNDTESPAAAASSTPESTGPSYVESEECRSAAAQALTDAESGASATDSATADRYAGLVSHEADTLSGTCSAAAVAALSEVADRLTSLYAVWGACEFMYGTCDASDFDVQRAFVKVNDAIDAARATIDAQG